MSDVVFGTCRRPAPADLDGVRGVGKRARVGGGIRLDRPPLFFAVARVSASWASAATEPKLAGPRRSGGLARDLHTRPRRSAALPCHRCLSKSVLGEADSRRFFGQRPRLEHWPRLPDALVVLVRGPVVCPDVEGIATSVPSRCVLILACGSCHHIGFVTSLFGIVERAQHHIWWSTGSTIHTYKHTPGTWVSGEVGSACAPNWCATTARHRNLCASRTHICSQKVGGLAFGPIPLANSVRFLTFNRCSIHRGRR